MCWPALAAVSALAGSVLQGVGAKSSMDQQAANERTQAGLYRRQAELTTISGAYKADRKQEQVDRVLGQNRAAYGASGVALSGSAQDVINDSATEGAMDIAAIRYNTTAEAQTQLYSGNVAEQSAKNTSKAANITFLTPIIGGVAKYGSSFK